MDQSRRQFVAETQDLIEQVLADLDELREHAGHAAPLELVDGLFRCIHRIKGSAASFGFGELSDIAHEFESLLSALRDGRASLDHELLDTCESATEALAESLDPSSSGAVEPTRRTLFERLQTLIPNTPDWSKGDLDDILDEIPFEFRQSLSDDERRQLGQMAKRGARLFVLTASFDTADFDDRFRSLKQALSRLGKVIATSPAVSLEDSRKIDFRILFTTEAGPGQLSSKLAEFARLKLTQLNSGMAQTGAVKGHENSTSRMRPKSKPPSANVIRMDSDDLDRLISSTHELFRMTNAALDLALAQIQVGGGFGRQELIHLGSQIGRSFLSIEKDLIDLRMVSVGPTLRRAARAGRSAARLGNKKVEFKIIGEDLRLDRILRDAIADPLIHLVRNAVDHGIETANEMGATENKRPLICLEAARDGKQTLIRVTDNGCGVDPEQVSKAAVRLGIIDPNAQIDMERSLRLIFRPGFTTLASASTVSGRGFGLDVVESGVEQVGGELRVSSAPGKGSTFEIRLPVTIGLVNTTVVSAGGFFYCIDSEEILRTETVGAGDVEFDGKKKFWKSDNEALPLLQLSELLGQTNGPRNQSHFQVVVWELREKAGSGETTRPTRMGIIVDGVKGSEEVLVRSLGRYSARWTGVAGAAELHDGTVALALDLPQLVRGTELSL